ncbi:MAG TPA: alpha/beta fold hydrolase [Thermoanaerobaculia bacterium]|nr:alpha/beta fold hydrolase [Thermoanaerobaculia bacterium]
MRMDVSFVLGVICALFADASAAAPPFSPRPCPDKTPELRCGTVTVPENRDHPQGRTIDLNVVIVQARNARTGAPPLFHVDGGPGIAATDAAAFYLGPGSLYRQDRDVVLFDQRGTGGSNPLRCPALEHRGPLQAMYSRNEINACIRDLKKRADLTQYSTENSADDIDRVREALGYPSIDIWALSYGTFLAQEYLKRYPERVHRVVLVGFVPLDYRAPLYHAANGQRVLDLVLYECQFDETCRTKYPDLRGDWRSLLRSLGERRGPIMEALRSSLGTAAAQRRTPFLIHAAAHGNLQLLLESFPKDSSRFAEGLNLSIVCSEAVSRIDPADVPGATSGTFVGDYRVRQDMAACENWPRHRVRDGFYDPLKTSPPILVIAGEMDNVAAPEWGYRFCSVLSECRFALIPNLGHGPFDLDAWTNGACFDEIAAGFFRDGLDTSCLKRMQPPPFK